MKLVSLTILILFFLTATLLNCTLYGSVAQIPYFGSRLVEKAEKDRDIFLQMYIAGGTMLATSEQVQAVSLRLARKVFVETLDSLIPGASPVKRLARRKTFDLAATLLRTLYWLPPFFLVILLLTLLLPKLRPKE